MTKKSEDNSKSFELKVVEAEYSDVGRSIARISNSIMEELGISTGDIIQIEGKRKTAAVAWRSRLVDEGKKLQRMIKFSKSECCG